MTDDEKKPTTLERVVRSPRFHMIIAGQRWTVWLRNEGVLEVVDGATLDDAITAAALRIAALDAAERKEPPPSPEGRSPRPEEVKP